MKDDIAQLRELQAIDITISKLNQEIAAGKAALDRRRTAIDQRRATIDQLQEKSTLTEQRRSELETELETETARLKDRQTKLMHVQTNREYQSILKEVEECKRGNKQREETIVQLMEQLEALKAKTEEESNLLSGEETLLTEETAQVEAQSAQLATEKERVVKNREEMATSVAAGLLKKYNTLLEKRNGLAVVAVINGVCHGCHMNIPPQLFNDLMKQDKLISCPTCHRIMFHQAEADA